MQLRAPFMRAPVRAAAAEAEAMERPRRPNPPRQPSESPQPSEDQPPPEPQRPTTGAGRGASMVEAGVSGVSIDYQRKQAKAMIEYFRAREFTEQVEKAQFFGWTKANEITNGRWVMFGFAVGLLTEYATGVDFPHQFALMGSYLGITDFFE